MRVGFGAGAAAVTIALTIVAAATGAPDIPQMFRGDAAHHGVYRVTGVEHFGGLQWRMQTEGMVQSSPVVSGGVLYAGSGDGHLYALDAATGGERWRFAAGSSISASPAVTDGLVFIGARDGAFYGLDARTGTKRWKVATGREAPLAWGFESGDIYTSSPVCAEGSVVFGSGDGQVYAVSAKTGAVRWKFPTGGRVRSTPAVSAGWVYVGSMDGTVYALDLATGKLAWRFDTEGHSLESGQFGFDRRTIQGSPAVVDGRVFVGSRDGHLYAIDAATGHLLWRIDHQMSWVVTSPAVYGGLVFAGSSDAHFVQAVEARTGKERWRFPTEGLVWSSPSIAEGIVYFGDGRGTLYAVDAATGSERWRYRAGRRIYSSPLPADGLLYVGNDDGGIYAIRGGPVPLSRAVFWDSTYSRANRVANHAEVRDFLSARGYTVLDAAALAAFMRDRAKDGSSSVVVFAMDHLPTAVAPVAGDSVLFRRYLGAGGKVVWLGTPPLIWPRDAKTGDLSYDQVDRGAAGRLLGVDFTRSNFDTWGNTVTRAGKTWGLSGWWDASWSVDPGAVTEALSVDDNGLAGSWVKNYGGPAGTGFVRIGGGGWTGGPAPNYAQIQAVAEYLPMPAR